MSLVIERRKYNKLMKKSLLILLPLMTLTLTGCRGRGRGSDTTSGGSNTSNPTTQTTGGSVTSTTSGGQSSQSTTTPRPTSESGDFDNNPGPEVDADSFELTFTSDEYKQVFPYVEAGKKYQFEFPAVCPGFMFNDAGTYISSYNGAYWLHMKNKDAGMQAFLSNHTPFKKAITKVEIVTRDDESASASMAFSVVIGNTHYVSGQTGGATGTGRGKTITATASKADNYHYFCITCTDQARNGQIVSLKVTLE